MSSHLEGALGENHVLKEPVVRGANSEVILAQAGVKIDGHFEIFQSCFFLVPFGAQRNTVMMGASYTLINTKTMAPRFYSYRSSRWSAGLVLSGQG